MAEASQTKTPTDMPGVPPSEVEPRIYERWLAADVFAPDGAGSGRPVRSRRS
jgi:hypothetical protein